MNQLERAFKELRTFALTYPETREDRPWGEIAIKVRNKTFVFMGHGEGKFSLSLKLTQRHEFALQYPFVTPTRYGLGKSGWITATFGGNDKPPIDVLAAWIDESFRAIAPKQLAAKIETPAPKARTPMRRSGKQLP